MRLWAKWRNPHLMGNQCQKQQELAADLVKIGDGLILPEMKIGIISDG